MKEQPMMVQENDKGANGTQIGQQINNYGMTYNDTKTLCLDLIRAELGKYKGEAEQIANQRNEELLSKLLTELEKIKINDRTVVEEFKNPDMQFVFLEAQKAYIRSGNEDLKNILTDLLSKRVSEHSATLLQIVLGEAVTVVHTLIPEQFDLLALCFIVQHTRFLAIRDLESFISYIKNTHLKLVIDTEIRESMFRHMEYSKVGNLSVINRTLENYIIDNYGGLFLKGYNIDELHGYEQRYPDYFRKCFQNSAKYQINAMYYGELENKLSKDQDIQLDDAEFIKSLYKSNIMSEGEVKEYICNKLPDAIALFNEWNETSINRFTLTSVGIVLGACRATQLTNHQFDLRIWV